MKIIVFEDVFEHQLRVENMLDKIAEELNIYMDVTSTGKPDEFLDYVNTGDTNQIYILDANIKGNPVLGFKMASQIKNRNPYALIIFISAHPEDKGLCFTYKTTALDFIEKDLPNDIFYYRLKENILFILETYIETEKLPDFFYFHSNNTRMTIPYEDIIMIETTGKSHKLRIIGKNTIQEFHGTIQQIEQDAVGKDYLFCPHKSYLINMNHVQSYDPKEKMILLVEGYSCPISRLKIQQFKDAMRDHNLSLRRVRESDFKRI